MSAPKFDYARVFDAEVRDFSLIPVSAYDAAYHYGRLLCPESDCNGALSYVGEHDFNSSERRKAHFRTNAKGEPHNPACAYLQEGQGTLTVSIAEALNSGLEILLNLNFPTSYDKEKARLSPPRARAELPRLGGMYRPDWAATTHRENGEKSYAPYSARTLKGLFAKTSLLKTAAQTLNISFSDVTPKVWVGCPDGIVPWSSFYLRDPPARSNGTATPASLHEEDVFRLLYDKFQATGLQYKRLWSPAPAMKKDITLVDGCRGLDYDGPLYAKIFRNVTIDGQRRTLQDTLEISKTAEDGLRAALKAADRFSIVATPFVWTSRLQQEVAQHRETLHLYWPVSRAEQIAIPRI